MEENSKDTQNASLAAESSPGQTEIDRRKAFNNVIKGMTETFERDGRWAAAIGNDDFTSTGQERKGLLFKTPKNNMMGGSVFTLFTTDGAYEFTIGNTTIKAVEDNRQVNEFDPEAPEMKKYRKVLNLIHEDPKTIANTKIEKRPDPDVDNKFQMVLKLNDGNGLETNVMLSPIRLKPENLAERIKVNKEAERNSPQREVKRAMEDIALAGEYLNVLKSPQAE